MKYRIVTILLFTLITYLSKADGYSTFLYHVEIILTNNRCVDGFFRNVETINDGHFKNSLELKNFLLLVTKDENGQITKLYRVCL